MTIPRISGTRSTRSVVFLLPTLLLSCATPSLRDLVSFDPPANPAAAASLVPLAFESEGAMMNGIAYLAAGAGPHPAVVLLHGYPGYERNLDLAQALRRDGWNVVFFHYRGAWGSAGTFSFGNALEDAAAVVRTVRSPAFSSEHRVDPEHVVLVGHSMGGWVALMTASADPEIDCVVSLAGANLGLMGLGLARDPQSRSEAAKRFDSWSGPIRGYGGRPAVADLMSQAPVWELGTRTGPLASKQVLLVAGTRDTDTPPDLHHRPLLEALRAANAVQVDEAILESDHAFSDARVALTRRVVGWLDANCR
jgi:dipeptidyl aminopeptidase/acylaminoacyl peptidase